MLLKGTYQRRLSFAFTKPMKSSEFSRDHLKRQCLKRCSVICWALTHKYKHLAASLEDASTITKHQVKKTCFHVTICTPRWPPPALPVGRHHLAPNFQRLSQIANLPAYVKRANNAVSNHHEHTCNELPESYLSSSRKLNVFSLRRKKEKRDCLYRRRRSVFALSQLFQVCHRVLVVRCRFSLWFSRSWTSKSWAGLWLLCSKTGSTWNIL